MSTTTVLAIIVILLALYALLSDLNRKLSSVVTSLRFLKADIKIMEKVIARHQSQINAIVTSKIRG